jgi:hypothetical protein
MLRPHSVLFPSPHDTSLGQFSFPRLQSTLQSSVYLNCASAPGAFERASANQASFGLSHATLSGDLGGGTFQT